MRARANLAAAAFDQLEQRYGSQQAIPAGELKFVLNTVLGAQQLSAQTAAQLPLLHQKRDWFETVVQVAFVAAAAWVTGGAAAGAGWGVIGSAAAAGAAGSFVSGAMNGDLSLKNVLRGALSGALTAGLVGPVGNALGGGAVGGVVARMTVQGGIQALLGGKFEDGAIAGLASGLAELSGAHMNKSIDDAVKAGTMTAAEAIAARGMARVFSSAVRTLGSPGDPQYAFASDLVGSVVNAGLDATRPAPAPTFTGTVFDDDGNLMPGVVEANASPFDQASRIAEQLQRQGLSQDEAVSVAGDWLQERLGAPQMALAPPSEESRRWTPQELEARVADVEQRLDEDLAAQQAREDSLLGPDELLDEVGGPGGARSPIQPVLNGRVDQALNAASDVAGLLQPLAEIRGAIGQLQAAQAEASIEAMRSQLRAAGVANVPADYERVWVQGGNSVRDYGATMDRLQSLYNDHLTNQRLTQTWGENWRDVRNGRSQMTPVEFERQVLQVQQQAANDAYARGVQLLATQQLSLKNGDYALTLGAYVDEQVRLELRTFGSAQGLPDSSASNVFAVNRQMRGQSLVGIPDLRLGYNLLSDVSLARKDSNTAQLQRWNLIRPNDTIIIRPDQLGGAYVVPRATIPAPRVSGRGG